MTRSLDAPARSPRPRANRHATSDIASSLSAQSSHLNGNAPNKQFELLRVCGAVHAPHISSDLALAPSVTHKCPSSPLPEPLWKRPPKRALCEPSSVPARALCVVSSPRPLGDATGDGAHCGPSPIEYCVRLAKRVRKYAASLPPPLKWSCRTSCQPGRRQVASHETIGRSLAHHAADEKAEQNQPGVIGAQPMWNQR